jgi:hypothetical protein
MDIKGSYIEIITGRYGVGNDEQNNVVDRILGDEYAKDRFELYFHWYNILHELGHGLMHYNAEVRPHPVDEEQIVNDFALAYWLLYGEKEKIDSLKSIITYALKHIKCPDTANIGYLEYARIHWGKPEFFNFNDYGWFQFSCVDHSLSKAKSLKDILIEMGVKNIKEQTDRKFTYSISDSEMPQKIVKDAVQVLRKWGTLLPDVNISYDNDPNRHMSNIINR